MAGKWISSGSLANVWVIPVPVAALDADTLAWVAAVVANGGSVSAARQIIVNDLIVGLKADGVWTNLDRLWLFAAEDQPSALTDVVGLALATAVNSPTFAVDEGYTGDGATSYIDSNFNPTTEAGNYSLDSATMLVWKGPKVVESEPVAGTLATPLTRFFLIAGYLVNWDVNDTTVGGPDDTQYGVNGLYLFTRTASNLQIYDFNGAEIQQDAGASTSLPNEDLVVLSGFGGSGFSANQCSCFGIAGGLSSGERVAIYNRLRTYMTAVGVP